MGPRNPSVRSCRNHTRLECVHFGTVYRYTFFDIDSHHRIARGCAPNTLDCSINNLAYTAKQILIIWRRNLTSLREGSFNFLLFGWPSPGPLALLSLLIWLSPIRELHVKPPRCVRRHGTHGRHLVILLFKLLTNPLRLSVGALMARD